MWMLVCLLLRFEGLHQVGGFHKHYNKQWLWCAQKVAPALLQQQLCLWQGQIPRGGGSALLFGSARGGRGGGRGVIPRHLLQTVLWA